MPFNSSSIIHLLHNMFVLVLSYACSSMQCVKIEWNHSWSQDQYAFLHRLQTFFGQTDFIGVLRKINGYKCILSDFKCIFSQFLAYINDTKTTGGPESVVLWGCLAGQT